MRYTLLPAGYPLIYLLQLTDRTNGDGRSIWFDEDGTQYKNVREITQHMKLNSHQQ